jgi:glutathione S-transferase
MPIRDERPTIVVFYGVKRPPLSAAVQEATAKLCSAALAFLPNQYANLFGEWSIADVDLAMMLNRLIMHGDEVLERLVVYANHQWQRPSIQHWVNLPRPGFGRV